MRESLDRLSPALVCSDLSVTAGVDNAHMVAALGYASMTYPLASPLVRMYLSHDRASVHEARLQACDMARKAARRCGLTLRASELAQIGRQALDYAINKTCPRCHGTKFETIPGTNCLGAHVCKACAGDGRRKLPAKHRKLIAEVVARIERIESILDSIVGKRV